MRPLTDQETKVFFEKLAKYIGQNIKYLIDREDEKYCFRLHNDRVYYVSQRLLKAAGPIGRKQLMSIGVCFGKFSKTGKFRLQITALDYIARYSTRRIWIKPTVEQSFLYGNHVLKSGLAKITDDTDSLSGVVIYNMSELPLGFGLSAKSTEECRSGTSGDIVAFNQADVGAYLRDEDTLL
ncbi:putative 60S ribosome subunit biogenesis protein NIP7 [Monocercomonoides exilis]|uniref:putative 60S ribosome subunit biogenesis protein NIP7 n=1 Tax=Monocercomonoides exilis TaxID=2049356 RepID=UPI0035598834|nr:putative 60S ribosome subunit biogenesis protein NIP7 [Monocercomonoides exilis]|eukprot:MONOS_128.1-p1 / transcript=MONOS_128.1 / gene=MONOS_128 / organism=Monocercomonoides_exilis_PA203 / gene_product=60S ribosome subunit biogenesis protein NIP7 homolog / transcript_product=60S ribosome subunit biogenesis protein NIP7 homolog / location=Mono_scaffold00002:244908-245740(-) / protein_length=180 / sequence_SO=supercontig / SO=protein_coding / is_pseudo=false